MGSGNNRKKEIESFFPIKNRFLILLFFFSRSVFGDQSSDCPYGWMDAQIEEDFKCVKSFRKDEPKEESERLHWPLIFLYEIKDGVASGPNSGMLRFLQALLRRYQVPDLSFLYAQTDILRIQKLQDKNLKVPIFCSVKSPFTDGMIIHFIDWYFDIESASFGWNYMIEAIDNCRNLMPWEAKEGCLFWRGATTDSHGSGAFHQKLEDFPRGVLVQKSLESPLRIDARFHWLAAPHFQSSFPTADFASIPKHLEYKYQIAMDGETATYPGYQWRLYSGCLCLKQDSSETMWYYGALKPWVHFVPVSRDLSNLEERLEWLMQNDEIARSIAENAYEFARNNLLPEHMLLYGYKVLLKYSSFLQ